MKQYLQSYQIILRTVGPVFVGNGREISKKEYVFLQNGKVGILNGDALYTAMAKRGKAGEFENYLLKNRRDDMTTWLRSQRIMIRELVPYVRYALDCGDAILDKGANRLQIMEHIKDPYGKPYIPGSSLKGMLRTILLAGDLLREPGKYAGLKKSMQENVRRGGTRNQFLKRDAAEIENRAYRTLQRDIQNPKSAVNDVLQGVIVSDSEPLSTKDLVLCQKVDRHTDGKEKTLPLLRECIKPGTEIRFTMTVDTDICALSGGDLMRAIDRFADMYYQNFAGSFRGISRIDNDCVFLGGGCGFVSKTIIYPMYGKQEGLPVAQRVFDVTVPASRTHKHDRDRQYGASPHIIKCTRYQGQTLQMGLCRVEKMQKV